MALEADRLRLSHSRMGTFQNCWRKGELGTFYKNPPFHVFEEDTQAADAGTAMHRGFQEWLRTGSQDAALWELGLAFPHTQSWAWDHKRGLEACAQTLVAGMQPGLLEGYELAFIERVVTNEDGDIEVRQYPAIEVPFEIIFDGVTLPDGRLVTWIGYIDAVMRHRHTGMFRSMDIKTHQRYGERIAEYKFNGQQLPYGIVLQHLQSEPLTEFEVLYLDMFIDLVEPRVQDFRFRKNTQNLEDLFLDTIMLIRQIHDYLKIGHFPKTQYGCLAYNKPCRFLPICDTNESALLQRLILQGAEPAAEREFDPWITVHVKVPEEWIPR